MVTLYEREVIWLAVFYLVTTSCTLQAGIIKPVCGCDDGTYSEALYKHKEWRLHVLLPAQSATSIFILIFITIVDKLLIMKLPQTPFIHLDLDCLEKNIRKMQSIADDTGVSVRPHAKTHKSCKIADLQLKAGANGLTVAKPEEAIIFMKSGVSSIMVCYPVVSEEKIKVLLSAADKYSVEILFVLDSLAGFSVLKNQVSQRMKNIDVYIEIDVGLHRCGLSPDNPGLIELAQTIVNSDNLNLRGITSHAGQSYGSKSRQEALGIAKHEQKLMANVKSKLLSNGIAIEEVCVGATPTLWVQKNFDGITEIKPGNYVFNDLTQKNIGVVGWDQLAVSVVTTVVSVNDTYLIVDAGSKSLTSDAGAHGSQGIQGYGLAFNFGDTPDDQSGQLVEKMSEEHGWIKHNGNKISVGSKLQVYPNHSCPVINLFDNVQVFKGSQFFESWPVDARGCVC